MTVYKTPGVYVEEIPSLPTSVAQVSTAIPAFIGYTEKALNTDGTDLVNKPKLISSLSDYEALFGYANASAITLDIVDIVSNTDPDKIENRTITAIPSNPSCKMYYSIQLYFMNGGGPCYIVCAGVYPKSVTKTSFDLGLEAIEKEDEPTLILFPDAVSLNKTDYYALISKALNLCNKLKDRFTIVDAINSKDGNPIADLRNTLSSDYLKYGAAYYPYLNTTLQYQYDEADLVINHIGIKAEEDKGSPGYLNAKSLLEIQKNFSADYHSIKAEIEKLRIILPPSSAIAGIYARVDNDRGVWKAPANVTLNGVISPTIKITNEQQDGYNIDPVGGKSINAIRTFAGKGVLVWGARTLAGNDNEWRYISVRRFFNMVEESIQKATAWVVFEPNDPNTWLRVKGMIENYLNGLWRQGALVGAKPQQAYFVNVGLGTTMTSQDVLEGKMNVKIGLATARPAEFITLKFSHKLQEA